MCWERVCWRPRARVGGSHCKGKSVTSPVRCAFVCFCACVLVCLCFFVLVRLSACVLVCLCLCLCVFVCLCLSLSLCACVSVCVCLFLSVLRESMIEHEKTQCQTVSGHRYRSWCRELVMENSWPSGPQNSKDIFARWVRSDPACLTHLDCRFAQTQIQTEESPTCCSPFVAANRPASWSSCLKFSSSQVATNWCSKQLSFSERRQKSTNIAVKMNLGSVAKTASPLPRKPGCFHTPTPYMKLMATRQVRFTSPMRIKKKRKAKTDAPLHLTLSLCRLSLSLCVCASKCFCVSLSLSRSLPSLSLSLSCSPSLSLSLFLSLALSLSPLSLSLLVSAALCLFVAVPVCLCVAAFVYLCVCFSLGLPFRGA